MSKYDPGLKSATLGRLRPLIFAPRGAGYRGQPGPLYAIF